ncbi:hypothetical protein BWO91_00870 [Plantibacter flavus]|uniref:DeoR/GlpR family DNA-binding transcription regulator n=1 Tax=Plantibacter flavus TaxID=150123 RepID=UPI00099B83CA|nr:DeoR/GlpR family DNA-binding transcription regulator [Plantibacter flavus]AQX78749.1 hypothetical protein BWO91_00870 [Plantibacter flavus]
MERSDRVILVADHSKLGRVLMSRVGGIEDVDVLITDADDGDEMVGAMPATVRVVLVEPRA